MEMVKLTIDGLPVEAEKGTSVIEAARKAGIEIPSLCYLKGINHQANCRVCLVEIGPRLIASCSLAVEEGMEVKTNTKKVRDARKTSVELLLSNHKRECTSCIRSDNCELQRVAKDLNIRNLNYEGEKTTLPIDASSPSIVRDPEKCILCGRCIATCSNVQTVNAVGWAGRGFDTRVAPAFDKNLGESNCVNCGQCIMACPVGALYEKESIKEVWAALNNPDKTVIVQTAPAIRVAIGEEFGLEIGTRATGKMVAALRKLGFDKVFDTDFAADLTIIEEGTELLKRLETGKNLPLMTSCCPGWVKFVEHNYPEMIDNLSTCKSPSEMEGALIKAYFQDKLGYDGKKIVVVSIMPCVGKKFSGEREEMNVGGLQDVDIVLTTRELARMIKEAGIDFSNLKEEDFDNPFGESSGAGVIFGATGGVTEAALRTIFDLTSGKDNEDIDIKIVRGNEGVKEASVTLTDGRTINAVIANGLGNARKVIEAQLKGEKQYQFIEIMACEGGCITGGGQPIIDSKTLEKINIKSLRAKAIYNEDEAKVIRKSHQNPYIKKIYEEYLGEPNGHKCHELLHTHYVKRSKY
ncbi:MAG: NADH-dependent [FeFe] hydrogenase, group A6 [Solirubrobacterales bacterium]